MPSTNFYISPELYKHMQIPIGNVGTGEFLNCRFKYKGTLLEFHAQEYPLIWKFRYNDVTMVKGLWKACYMTFIVSKCKTNTILVDGSYIYITLKQDIQNNYNLNLHV